MKKADNFLKNRSFRSKILISFLLVSMIPLMLMSILSYNISNNIIYKNTQGNAEIIIDRVRDELNELISETLSFAGSIAENTIILDALKGNFQPEDLQSRLNADAGEELLRIFGYREDLYGITVIGENGQTLFNNELPTRSEDFRTKYWYREILQNPFVLSYYPPHAGSYVFDTEDVSLISIGIPIESPETTARIGVVLIDIQESILKDILTSRLGETGYLFIQYGRSGFTSSGDQAPDSEYLVSLAKKETIEPERLKQKKEMVLIRDLIIPDIRLATVINLRKLTNDSRIMGIYFIVLIFASLIVSIFMASIISLSIAHPIKDLRTLMKIVESGDLSVRMEHIHNDDLGDLSRSFNQMIQRVQNLMEDVRNDQIKLRKAELKTLQAQINPHFLYNTLDSINWLSREKRNDDIVQMVTALTTLFRTGVSKGQDIIPVSEEIKHIESYLTIQKIRYEQKFAYELDIDESVLDCLIIKLVLQPLVENAMYHGVKMKSGKGLISIRARKINQLVLIEVSDNGAGMSEERLHAVLNEMNDQGMEIEKTVYGLKNVNDRLRIYYGESYGLRIHSVEGEGTVVTIKIPEKDINNA